MMFRNFIFVGILSTIINYGLVLMLHNILGINIYFSSFAGYLTGLLFGFFFNKAWTFKSSRHFFDEIIKYLFVYFSNFIISLVILYSLIAIDFADELAVLVAIFYTTLANFFGLKKWVFTN